MHRRLNAVLLWLGISGFSALLLCASPETYRESALSVTFPLGSAASAQTPEVATALPCGVGPQ